MKINKILLSKINDYFYKILAILSKEYCQNRAKFYAISNNIGQWSECLASGKIAERTSRSVSD
jgi:hypothetical protein